MDYRSDRAQYSSEEIIDLADSTIREEAHNQRLAFFNVGSHVVGDPNGHKLVYDPATLPTRPTIMTPEAGPIRLIRTLAQLHISGLLMVSLCLVGLLTGIMMLTTYILEFSLVKDIMANRNFIGAFLTFDVLIVLIYRDITTQNTKKMTAKPRMLDNLLNSILKLATDMHSAINTRQLKQLDQNMRAIVREDIIHYYVVVNVLQTLAIRFVSKNWRVRRLVYPPLVAKFVDRNEYSRELFKDEEIAIHLVAGLLKQIAGKLADNGLLQGSQLSSQINMVNQMIDHMTPIRQEKRIKLPVAIKGILLVVLLIYTLIVLPLYMYQQVDVLSVFFYPLAVFLFLAPFIYFYFYGKPFDRHSKHDMSQFDHWMRRMQYICNLLGNDVLRRIEKTDEVSAIEK